MAMVNWQTDKNPDGLHSRRHHASLVHAKAALISVGIEDAQVFFQSSDLR